MCVYPYVETGKRLLTSIPSKIDFENRGVHVHVRSCSYDTCRNACRFCSSFVASLVHVLSHQQTSERQNIPRNTVLLWSPIDPSRGSTGRNKLYWPSF
ncbi:hypothetical protein ANTQUA_LOCUS10179 [Anthophora quadrimaculata]